MVRRFSPSPHAKHPQSLAYGLPVYYTYIGNALGDGPNDTIGRMKWYEWVFGGIGVTVLSVLVWIFRRIFVRAPQIRHPGPAIQATATTGDRSPVAIGNHITQQLIQSPPALDISSQKRHDEWQKLIQELPGILEEMAPDFISWRKGGIIDVEGDTPDRSGAVARGNRMVRNLLYISDEFKDSGLLDRWNELVSGVEAGDFPLVSNEFRHSIASRYSWKRRAFEDQLIHVAREDLKKR